MPSVVEGIPVEYVSTETMTTRRASRYAQVNEIYEGRNGQRTAMLVNFVIGILVPAYAMVIYLKHGEAPCDKPVAGWLYTFSVVGFTLGCVNLYINLKKLILAPILEHAQTFQDDPDGQVQAIAPAAPVLAQMACLTCCVTVPLGVFQFFWWIKGNFDVWGTYPRYGISPDEPCPFEGCEGCDAHLLGGARSIYFAMYVIIGFVLCSLCAVCAMVVERVDGIYHERHGMV